MVGAGYTGSQVWRRLPGGERLRVTRRDGLGHSLRVDLDASPLAAINLPAAARVLYTVPPAPRGYRDDRLSGFLRALTGPPERLVYLSTTGVYGDAEGDLVDEDTTPAPVTDRARRRADAEKQLAAWSRRTGCAVTVLRVPGIYGPGRLGLERLQNGEAVLAESDATPGNRIHVHDLASACLAALAGDAPPGIYNVGDGDHRSASAFSRTVAKLAGLPPPPEISLAEARRTWSPMRLSFQAESRRIDTRRMRDVLGVALRYGSVEDGIKASLAVR